jgi:lipoate-protein ligase B
MTRVDERTLAVRWLGRVPYAEALALQERLVEERRNGVVPDTLLLVEHPHVITLGTASSRAHILVDDRERAARSIDLVETGRGGDVTYHGPGQLVGYPILDLKPNRKDLHRYLRDLEEVLIRALAALRVEAHRVPGLTGVWTHGGKIAAIGVRVSSGWITSHGFALNVSTDLGYFRTIVPCGISDREVTSLSVEAGREVTLDEAREAVEEAFQEVFGGREL